MRGYPAVPSVGRRAAPLLWRHRWRQGRCGRARLPCHNHSLMFLGVDPGQCSDPCKCGLRACKAPAGDAPCSNRPARVTWDSQVVSEGAARPPSNIFYSTLLHQSNRSWSWLSMTVTTPFCRLCSASTPRCWGHGLMPPSAHLHAKLRPYKGPCNPDALPGANSSWRSATKIDSLKFVGEKSILTPLGIFARCRQKNGPTTNNTFGARNKPQNGYCGMSNLESTL